MFANSLPATGGGHMRAEKPVIFLFLTCAVMTSWAPAAAADASLPAALAQTVAFRGRVTYEAYRADDPTQTVDGTLVVRGDGWDLEERSADSALHVSGEQSWIRNGSQTAFFDDPFEVDALANSWAVVLGSSAGSIVSHDPGSASWTTGTGVRLYLDPDGAEVVGASDNRASGDMSFVYAQWTTVNGLRVPHSILRMRRGVADASISIDGYQVQWAPDSGIAHKGVVRATSGSPALPATSHSDAVSVAAPSPWRPFSALFALFAIALGCVVWARRDALIAGLSRRLADDSRAWRHEGINLFVSPEGVLWFEGRPYRVGVAFFARTALVQSSPLFIRVSAPQVPRAVVLARKFPLPRPVTAATHSAKRSTAGFTLIESLAATSLFAAVVVAAVFPALIVLARADLLAAQHETALQIAANALADEEAALAYGTTISDGSVSSSVAGMTLRVTVAPAGVSHLHAITVDVSDARDRILARLVSMAGPPVPPPGAPSPAPTDPGRTR
jgi:hypothetical protein